MAETKSTPTARWGDEEEPEENNLTSTSNATTDELVNLESLSIKEDAKPPETKSTLPARWGDEEDAKPPETKSTLPARWGDEEDAKPPETKSTLPARWGDEEDAKPPETKSTLPARWGDEEDAKPPETKSTLPARWGDEEELEDDNPSSAFNPTTDERVNLESLSIKEDVKPPEALDEPNESEIKAIPSGDTLYTSAMSFEELNLSPDLLKGLYVEMGFTRPSKIQAISLPMILTPPYKNLIAQAHNGSGKTTCFVLGMLSRVDPTKKVPQALCICPTRELAIQNEEVLLRMGKYSGISSVCAVPTDVGSYTPAVKREPVSEQVVIGTPGTLKKWMTYKKLSTRYIKILVFDEADHMLSEGGFKDDSERIMKDIERNNVGGCQVLLFSATFNETVKSFASRVVKDANQLFVKKEELSLASIKQYKVRCPDELAKMEVIKDKIFLLGGKVGQTIIFVRTRNSASKLHETLQAEGYECTSIQGALQQEARDRIIGEFRRGLTKVLISTDVLARGFDQSQVNLVVNYDLPVNHSSPREPDYEVYLHRIGRTGRFGRKGAVFNLICNKKEEQIMEKIENHFQHHVSEVPKWDSEDDFEAALKEAGLA